MRRILAVFIISFLPSILFADTTVYICKKNGQTILEGTLSPDCDSVETYRYSNLNKDPQKSTNDLRPGEIQLLQQTDNGPYSAQSQMRRYENIDERVGWSLANEHIDNRQDKCSFYQAMLNSALSYVAVKNEQDVEIGPYRSVQLINQIDYAHTQVNYYCR